MKAGDTIQARVEVAEVIANRNRIRLETVCTNQRAEEVLSGEAWVMPSRTSVIYEERPPDMTSLSRLMLQPWAWAAQAMALWGSVAVALVSVPPRRA